MPATPEKLDWVRRVLGVSAGAGSPPPFADLGLDAPKFASLSDKVGKLASVARPTEPPKLVATERLLSAFAGKPAPPDPLDAADHVAQFVPGFLGTIERERPVASSQLGVGETLGGQDRVLGLADLFAAAQRSLIAWETLLARTEQTNKEVDALEKAKERDQDAYASKLASYNNLRAQSLEAEAEALPQLETLQAKFNTLSASQQQEAVKEAAHA